MPISRNPQRATVTTGDECIAIHDALDSRAERRRGQT
jgi:hypothetical protein